MSTCDLETGRALEEPGTGPRIKRQRLNLACNYCRSRKTKCDEQKPSCHACLAAGLPCVTTDRKRPGERVERRKAGKNASEPRLYRIQDGSLQVNVANPANEGASVTPVSVRLPTATPEQLQPGATNVGEEPSGREEQPRAAENHGGERFRGLLPIMKYDTGSSTVEILSGWLNVAFYRLGLKHRFSFHAPLATFLPLPLAAAQIPRIPDSAQYLPLVKNYFQKVNAVYPILSTEEVDRYLQSFLEDGFEACVSTSEGLSKTVTLLLVLHLGRSGITTDNCAELDVVGFCKDMVGRLVRRPTLCNIKTLFLLALAVYHHDDLTYAWTILNISISMTITVGLNKSITIKTLTDEDDRSRTWWSIYAFENLLAFELGRRSSITEDRLSPSVPVASSPYFVSEQQPRTPHTTADDDPIQQQQHHALVFFKAIISLASLLSEIGTRCIDIREREETSTQDTIHRIVSEKVRITGESCLKLTNWSESLPNHLRPSSDLIYDSSSFPQAAFLSVHYNNALLVLTRNSLLLSESALRNSTEIIAKDQPWSTVIRNGQSMAANCARRLVKLYIEAEEIGLPLLMPSANASLHASYVLSVHLLQHPKSRLAETDLSVGFEKSSHDSFDNY